MRKIFDKFDNTLSQIDAILDKSPTDSQLKEMMDFLDDFIYKIEERIEKINQLMIKRGL